jgi:hypothetical protein
LSAIAFDPLIAEAKERAHRRRLFLLLLAGSVVAVLAARTPLALWSSGNSSGLCATPPFGFKQRTVTGVNGAPMTVVLTNFRFGRMSDHFGLVTAVPHPRPWPAGGVTVAVSNFGPAKSSGPKAGLLRVNRAAFGGMEGATLPAAEFRIELNGRSVGAYVEVGALTPATIAAANQALTSVHTCSP